MTQEQVDGLLGAWGWGFGVEVFWVGWGMCSISPWRCVWDLKVELGWGGLDWVGTGGCTSKK